MSDEKTEPKQPAPQKPQDKREELTVEDLEHVSGGSGVGGAVVLKLKLDG